MLLDDLKGRTVNSILVLFILLGGLTMNAVAAEGKLDGTLTAVGRSPEIPESDDLYGWLVGSWELDIRNYWGDISDRKLKAEVHAAWVLEGRAIQDVWIIPRPEQRSSLPDPKLFSYGTTLRVWDPKIRAWHVTWINPVTATEVRLVARRSGKDIVQVGTNPAGTPIRWTFRDITKDSFRWTGETLQSDGQTWKVEGDFLARRIH
jgi:hypothetical protein